MTIEIVLCSFFSFKYHQYDLIKHDSGIDCMV